MCGIMGYTGPRRVVDVVVGGLDAKTGKITPLAPKGCYGFKFISETEIGRAHV